jgi:putative nucleotidyltransferase with HDIG domain
LTQLDIAEVRRAVRSSTPYVLRLRGSVPESFPLLDSVLEAYLTELGQEKVLEALSYCVKELTLNAEKANAKRIYFEEHGLEILRKDDYEKGMRGFHAELSENLEHFLQRLQERRMSIDVTFQSTEEALAVSVKNDAALAPMEQARIKERIARARTFRSFSEALETSLDHSEGAGLGIMILLQFLKSVGLDEKALSITTENGRTVSSIVIPISNVQLDQIRMLAEVLARTIESLPHFPENVARLIQLTEDANARVSDISGRISNDPALTAELLKHVNSAYYGLPSRVNSIPKAVKLIGLRSLHHLLYSFGFHMVLDPHRAEVRSLWEHSLRTAFYASLLARDLRRQPEILDDAYVAGILHDLGFIALTSLHPRTQLRIRRFSMEKNIPPAVLERFSFGMNHADLGALIAQKWNFPDQLIEGIKYHHDPLRASLRHRNVVFCVYLANALCDLQQGLLSYQHLDRTVLRDFGLRTEAQVLDVASGLKSAFESRRGEPNRL